MVNILNAISLREEESVRMFSFEKTWLSANTYRLPGGEKKNEMYAVFFLKAGCRLIGGNNREANFYFYPKSIFLVTRATQLWIWLPSKD